MSTVYHRMTCFILVWGMVDSLTDISEYHYYHYYWEGSVMRLLCKTPNSKKIDYCSWSVDSKKVIESSGYSPSPNQRQIYQLFGDFVKGECGIIVATVSSQDSGEWKCQMYSTEPKEYYGSDYAVSSTITVFRLTLREFVLISCCLTVLAMSVAISVYLVKQRRSTPATPIQEMPTADSIEQTDPSAPAVNDLNRHPPTYTIAMAYKATAENENYHR